MGKRRETTQSGGSAVKRQSRSEKPIEQTEPESTGDPAEIEENLATGGIGDSQLQNLNQTRQRLNRGQDRKDDYVLAKTGDFNWAQLLTPAPTSICLLGQLMVVSTQKDFSLKEACPSTGFKHVRHPDSFRACLLQVAHDGWDAFNEAHTSMDQIKLMSATMPEHLTTVVKYLLQGTDDDVKDFVPSKLDEIDNISVQCEKLAGNVEETFKGVMALLSELIEVCKAKEGLQGRDLEEVQQKLQVANQKEKNLEQEKKMAEERAKKMEEDQKRSMKQYNDAVKSMPSGWSMIGMSLVERITGGFRDSLSSDVDGNSEKPLSKEMLDEQSAFKVIVENAPLLNDFIRQLEGAIREMSENTNPNGNEINNTISAVKHQLPYILEAVTSIKCKKLKPLQTNTETICKDANKICDTMLGLLRGIGGTSDKVKEQLRKAQDLVGRSSALQTAVQTKCGGAAMESDSLYQARKKPQGRGTSSCVGAHVENVRYQIKQSAVMLENSEKRADKAFEDLRESNRRMTDILAEVTSLNLKEIDYKKIIEILLKGISVLAELRENWGKLVRFFTKVHNLIKCQFTPFLQEFVKDMAIHQQRKEEGRFTMSDACRNAMYEVTLKAAQIAYHVHMVSGAYVQVSENHIMDKLASLDRVMGMDPDKESAQIDQWRMKLTSDCNKAAKDIEMLVDKEQRKYEQTVRKRQDVIKQEMDKAFKALPPPPPAMEKISEQAIDDAKKMAEEIPLDDFI